MLHYWVPPCQLPTVKSRNDYNVKVLCKKCLFNALHFAYLLSDSRLAGLKPWMCHHWVDELAEPLPLHRLGIVPKPYR